MLSIFFSSSVIYHLVIARLILPLFLTKGTANVFFSFFFVSFGRCDSQSTIQTYAFVRFVHSARAVSQWTWLDRRFLSLDILYFIFLPFLFIYMVQWIVYWNVKMASVEWHSMLLIKGEIWRKKKQKIDENVFITEKTLCTRKT